MMARCIGEEMMRQSAKLRGSAAILAMALFVPALTHAQEAGTPQDNPGDEIVVTGTYAQSLKQARDKKRDAPTVIEAISISDLNQLPDVSIADALSRLPGLAAQRDSNNGAKSTISLRGMGPALTLGTLNNRDLATATPDRNVRYDQFPAELIGGATVYKSPMASIVEGGVSGSIDLQTVRPLDYRKNVLTVSVQGAYNQFGDDYAADKKMGVRGSVSYIGRFFDNTLGIAVGYSGRSEPYNELRTQHASYDPGGYTDYNGDGVVDDTSYGLYHNLRTGTDTRHGAVGVVEWRPSDRFRAYIDGTWSKVKLDGELHGVTANNFNQQYINNTLNPVVVGGGPAATNHGKLVAGTITTYPGYEYLGVDVQAYSGISRRNDVLWSVGGNFVWNPTDRIEVRSDTAYSKTVYDADYWELRTQAVGSVGGVLQQLPGQAITFDARPNVPTFSVNFDLTNPDIMRPYSLSAPYLQIGQDKIFTNSGDVIYNVDSGFIDNIRVGYRYVDRSKRFRTLDGGYSIADLNSRPILQNGEILPYALGSYDGVQAGAAPRFLTFDFFKVANRVFGGLTTYETNVNKTENWDISERTLAGYGQIDFGGDGPLTGNIGLRVVHTRDTSSSARLTDNSGTVVVAPFTVKNSYTDWLPSLNLTYEAGGGVQFRLGLAKTIARPGIDDLNAGIQTYAYPGFNSFSAYGGNPKLEPYRANQVDLGVEYYFGKNDMIALTGFYKDLSTYITTANSTVDIDGTNYQFFRPVNASGGYIRGFELTVQKSLDFLPGPFQSMGVYANYAFVDSDVRVSRNYTDVTLGLLGLSRHTGTATLWYYKSGLDARVSYNYRSSYPYVVDGGAFETVDASGYLDAQVSYEFVKGISGFVQGSNLTNTGYGTRIGGYPQLRGRYAEYGRIFYFGVRASF